MLKVGLACVALGMLALAACSTSSKPQTGPENLAVAAVGDNTGVALISTGASGSCIVASTNLKVFPDGARYKGGFNSGEVATLVVDNGYLQSDFADQFGFVHALRLPAGRYYASPWVANHMITTSSAPRFDFTVDAGRTVYLGQYLLPGSCSPGSEVEIVDRWDRDRAIYAARNPAIDLSDVVVRPLVLTGVSKGM
jgi:hypothetical protein